MAFTTDIDPAREQRVGLRKFDVERNEYIYMQGVASCAAGSWVSFDENYVPVLLAANAKGRVAIAMAAIDSTSKFGWYQIYGKAVGKVASGFADNGIPFSTATPGTVDDAVVAGDLISGAMGRSAINTPVTGQAYFELDYPFVNDATGS